MLRDFDLPAAAAVVVAGASTRFQSVAGAFSTLKQQSVCSKVVVAINYSDLFPTLIVGYSKERGCACPRNLGKAAITLLQDDLRSTYHQARQDHIRKWRLIRMTYSDRISLCLDTLTICRSNNCRRTLLAASRLVARCMYVVGIENPIGNE